MRTLADLRKRLQDRPARAQFATNRWLELIQKRKAKIFLTVDRAASDMPSRSANGGRAFDMRSRGRLSKPVAKSVVLPLSIFLACPLWWSPSWAVADTRQPTTSKQPPSSASQAEKAKTGEDPAKDAGQKSFSPLHQFLGIDADTGQFEPVEGATVETEADSPVEPSAESGSPTDESKSGPSNERQQNSPSEGRRVSSDHELNEAIRSNEAFRRAAESIEKGSLPELAEWLDGSASSHPLFRLHRQIVWITAALLMVYPIGMVLAELFVFFSCRRRAGFTDRDRQYHRIRLRRRLTLAGIISVLILLIAFGGARGYWWGQPTQLAIFGIALLVLGCAAVLLANLIRNAARTYQLDLIREIRRDQLELRSDLEELRRHLTPTASS